MEERDADQGLVAPCGLDCEECKAFKATQAEDDGMREEVAEEWARAYNIALDPSVINCDGCMSGSDRLIGHCIDCPIRKCAQERGYSTCAECPD